MIGFIAASRPVLHLRVVAAVALILELVVDVVTVAAGDHRELRMSQHDFTSIKPPERPVPVTNVVY